jgi:hypothetical protein
MIMGEVRKARSATGRTFERNSYRAFVIGGIVLVSALLMTMQYVFAPRMVGYDGEIGLCDGLRL